jgi:hypothetical protein
MRYAWEFASILIPISFGWAIGDYSLSSFMQKSLAKERLKDDNISPHGAITSFLYVSYIILYIVLSTSLGKYIDVEFNKVGNIKNVLIFIGGVQFSILSVMLLGNTFIWKDMNKIENEVEERANRRSNYYSMLYVAVPTTLNRSQEKVSDRTKLMGQYRYE